MTVTTQPTSTPTVGINLPTLALTWVPCHDGLRHVGPPSPPLLGEIGFPRIVPITACGLGTVPLAVEDTEEHLPCEACLLALLALADSAFPDGDPDETT